MDVKLIVEKGSGKGRTIQLRSEEAIVGRQSGCDLRIPSAAVSRRHCRLSFRDEFLVVEDLESANGTFVNGNPVQGTHIIRPGDRLEIGPITFVVKYQLTPAAIDRLLREEQAAEAEVLEEVDDAPEVDVEEVETAEIDIKKSAEDKKKAQKKPLPPKTSKPSDPKKPVKKPPPIPKEDEVEDVQVMDDVSWNMPAGEDLRNILSEFDDK